MALVLMNMNSIVAVAAPFFAVFITHYSATNLYAYICANLSLRGFILSMLTTSSPICNALLTIITHTQTSYAAIVSGLIGLLIQQLMFQNQLPAPTTQ